MDGGREALVEAKRWVVKVGSNVMLRDDWRLDRVMFAGLIRGIDALMSGGAQVTLVSSGAVALGRQAMGVRERPRDVATLQALAALGQSRLMRLYEEELGYYDRRAAQLLFSRGDLDERSRYLNARSALEALRTFGAVPVVNENDTVATESLRFGDNDMLAAMTCGLVGADVLVLLSDVNGICEIEGEGESRRLGERISSVAVEDEHLDEIAGGPLSGVGTGGMRAKVAAARVAARAGASTVVAPGRMPGVLEALARGEDVGTLMRASGEGVGGRKLWLSAGAMPVGSIWCDEGARRALVERGASLLPSGVVAVEGEFEQGAVVDIGVGGEVFARGIAVYGASELAVIAGRRSEEIADLLGYRVLDVVVHRDALLVL
jgi:glutamate 5-kinase